nr:protein strictosidine synthase-like 2-like [Tanacetum cinerariifolium]GEY55992.1 protein strictosidine synthase-like 2-like [Tanacetum cinerariifolium]
MRNTTVLLTLSTVVMFISMLLSLGFPFRKHIRDGDRFEVIPINGSGIGPESFEFSPFHDTGPYTGVSDGRIIKWISSDRRWTDFAVTSPHRDRCGGPEMEHICGRPLGLMLDKSNGNLYIADAYFGLVVVDADGGLATSLASVVEGIPLLFTNALDIDHTNGVIYFTDSSQRYTRRDHTLVVLTNDKTGRLLKYDLKSKEVTIQLSNLSFPNGVALSQDGNFLLLAETTNCRVLRFWLKTPKAGTLEVFADLPGYPDNIKRNHNGEFWVAMYSRKSIFLKWIHVNPWIIYALSMLPIDVAKVTSYIAKAGGEGLASKLGVDGKIMKTLDDVNAKRAITRWNRNEEILLAETWIEHSQDVNIEKDQQDDVYWNLIMEDFNSRTTAPPRTKNMMMEKWTRMHDIYKHLTRKSGESDADLVENAKTSYIERCGKKFQYDHVWNILKNYPKWNAAEPIDEDNIQELFGPDPRERPAGKQRASKKQKSVGTSSTGGSQSESVSGLLSQDYRRKCEVAERAYEAKRDKKTSDDAV